MATNAPRCTCGGPYNPEYALDGHRVTSLRCVICNKRIWRDFAVRRPSRIERDMEKGKGQARKASGVAL